MFGATKVSRICAVLGFWIAVYLHFGCGQMPNLCFDCINLLRGQRYSFCPKDGPVDFAISKPLACNGTCFSRSSREDDSVMIRGCSSTVGNLPLPLPEDGCYDHDGTTVCICSKPLCNIGPLGISSGVSLTAHLTDESSSGQYPDDTPDVLYCHQCSNYDQGGNFYAQCPRDSMVIPHMVYSGNCSGACFTRTRNADDKSVYRGCTDTQYGLPYPLPPDGCYNWNDEVYCLCSKSRCNRQPMGVTSGLEMDYHLDNIDVAVVETDGINKCYDCSNYDLEGKYYPQCPKQSRVRNAYMAGCNGTCFTRSYHNNASMVTRGCTDTQYGLPYPLPPDGCYDWNDDVWCICSGSRCNRDAIGVSSTLAMDYHLSNFDEPIEEEDGINKCFQCINYDQAGNYYRQCPKHERVRNAYLGACNGTCFIRSYDYNASLVARGCTDSQYGLPDPLPPDGCYKWYSEVWCVCSTSRCNGKALGKPQDIEFDAHIDKESNAAQSRMIYGSLLMPLLVIAVFISQDGLKWIL